MRCIRHSKNSRIRCGFFLCNYCPCFGMCFCKLIIVHAVHLRALISCSSECCLNHCVLCRCAMSGHCNITRTMISYQQEKCNINYFTLKIPESDPGSGVPIDTMSGHKFVPRTPHNQGQNGREKETEGCLLSWSRVEGNSRCEGNAISSILR